MGHTSYFPFYYIVWFKMAAEFPTRPPKRGVLVGKWDLGSVFLSKRALTEPTDISDGWNATDARTWLKWCDGSTLVSCKLWGQKLVQQRRKRGKMSWMGESMKISIPIALSIPTAPAHGANLKTQRETLLRMISALSCESWCPSKWRWKKGNRNHNLHGQLTQKQINLDLYTEDYDFSTILFM